MTEGVRPKGFTPFFVLRSRNLGFCFWAARTCSCPFAVARGPAIYSRQGSSSVRRMFSHCLLLTRFRRSFRIRRFSSRMARSNGAGKYTSRMAIASRKAAEADITMVFITIRRPLSRWG